MARDDERPDDEPLDDAVEEFLAAPENLRRSATELRKAKARKEREVARRMRERASKRTELPTVEDLLADMVRVAEDEVTNPWHEWRILSRRRYEMFGHYPIDHVLREFGQFEHAKQVAGLADQPGTRLMLAARAHASRAEHADRYYERWVLPHVVKGAHVRRAAAGVKLVLSISDTHATYLDPFTWYAFLSACRDLQPDVVVVNGDALEGSRISRHPKIPGHTIPLQIEFDFVRTMFEQIRACSPVDAEVLFVGGNHGVSRWARYLTQVAREIADLRTLRFDQLLGLGDLDITLAQGGEFISPPGQEGTRGGEVLYDCLRVTHGTKLGQYPAAAEMRQWGMSGISGHVHRAHVFYGGAEATRALCWMTTPCGCTERASIAYVKDHEGWQRGFGLTWVYGDRVRSQVVLTDDRLALFEGYAYTDPGGLPEPDVMENWLEGFPLP